VNKKLEAFQSKHIWDLAPLPPGANLVATSGYKKIKIESNESAE